MGKLVGIHVSLQTTRFNVGVLKFTALLVQLNGFQFFSLWLMNQETSILTPAVRGE